MAVVEVHVYDKAFAWQGMVGEYNGLRATRAHLAVSDAEFTAPSDLDVRDALAAPGAHAVITYDGAPFVGGWVEDAGTVDPLGDVTYRVTGHYQLTHMVTGWPVPAGALTSGQTVAYWRTSPTRVAAETAVKAVVSANATRLSLPVTVATDQARGGLVELSYRFHPLPDRWTTALEEAGLGVTVELDEGAGYVVDCYVPTVHSLPLSLTGGEIQGGSWTRSRPTASRVVAGAQGEAEARTFFGPYVDTARETAWGFCGEVFIDARDTDVSADVAARAAEALAAAASKVSVDFTLAETEDFQYGPFQVGDRVTVEYAPGFTTEDVLTEATLLHSSDVPAPEVTFRLGKREDDESDRAWRAVSSVAAGVRDLYKR